MKKFYKTQTSLRLSKDLRNSHEHFHLSAPTILKCIDHLFP
jgi:hypothetical protein